MNLLIVDDEIYAVQGILDSVDWTRANFDHVFKAYNMTQAKDILKAHIIDIMICDIEMPNGSGIELLRWVNGLFPKIKCIFLTCHDEFSYAQQAIHLKCFEYILKPVLGEDMTALLIRTKKVVEDEKKKENYSNFGKTYLETYGTETKSIDIKKNEVEEAEKYILGHIGEVLTCDDIAAAVHCDPEQLKREFMEKHHCAVEDYIIEQRLFLARELLERNEMSVSMVSASVGYSNYLYFTRLFKAHFGVSPKDYQKKYRK